MIKIIDRKKRNEEDLFKLEEKIDIEISEKSKQLVKDENIEDGNLFVSTYISDDEYYIAYYDLAYYKSMTNKELKEELEELKNQLDEFEDAYNEDDFEDEYKEDLYSLEIDICAFQIVVDEKLQKIEPDFNEEYKKALQEIQEELDFLEMDIENIKSDIG